MSENIKALPDYLKQGLKIVFIGFNPGLASARSGHHYAGRNNNFWRLLAESGLTPYHLSPEEDFKLPELGYGLTNIVSRPSRKASELSNEEYNEGRLILRNKLIEYRPAFACYMGVGVFREFSQQKEFSRGLQHESQIAGIKDYVISSPSGLNRTPYQEQLKRYQELKELVGK